MCKLRQFTLESLLMRHKEKDNAIYSLCHKAFSSVILFVNAWEEYDSFAL